MKTFTQFNAIDAFRFVCVTVFIHTELLINIADNKYLFENERERERVSMCVCVDVSKIFHAFYVRVARLGSTTWFFHVSSPFHHCINTSGTLWKLYHQQYTKSIAFNEIDSNHFILAFGVVYRMNASSF